MSKTLDLNPSVANRFHELFTNSQLHLVKDAGHFVQLDRPDETADLMNSFIDALH